MQILGEILGGMLGASPQTLRIYRFGPSTGSAETIKVPQTIKVPCTLNKIPSVLTARQASTVCAIPACKASSSSPG
jgi:hypothetical protein